MLSGMIFGLIWCVSFLFLVRGSVSLNAVAHPLIIAMPFLGFWFARKFRHDVQNDGQVTYWRGYFFSLLLYLYATTILAIVSFLYFKFMDHGAFALKNIALMDSQEMKDLFSMPQMQSSLNGMTREDFKTLFRELTPSTFAALVINFNVFLAFILAIPTAFFAMTKKKTTPTENTVSPK